MPVSILLAPPLAWIVEINSLTSSSNMLCVNYLMGAASHTYCPVELFDFSCVSVLFSQLSDDLLDKDYVVVVGTCKLVKKKLLKIT